MQKKTDRVHKELAATGRARPPEKKVGGKNSRGKKAREGPWGKKIPTKKRLIGKNPIGGKLCVGDCVSG